MLEEEEDGAGAPDEGAAAARRGGANPHNIEAEQALLGGLLIDSEQFDLIEGRVAEDDFIAPTHGMVLSAMQALRKRQQPIDMVLLRAELQAAGRLEAVGGATGLAALTDAATTGANVEYYAGIVQELSAKRRLIKTLVESLNTASASDSKVVDLIGEIENGMQRIVARSHHDKVFPIAEVLNKTWDSIDKFQKSQNNAETGALPTGFTELDEMLSGGLHEDELVIIAGRPSMGKSTFALNLFRNAAAKAGHPAAFFTLEMSAENIVKNLLAAHARVEGQKLRRLHFSDDEMTRLINASSEFREMPMWIDETPAISLPELRGKARHLSLKQGIKLIVIDYLQLMTASNLAKNRSREQEVSEISRGLKALAKELHIPVIALSQLSRKPEGRQESRPILSDLRESGAIEQDADVVLMLHRHEYYNPGEKPGEAEVIIAKQRNGPTGTVSLAFINNQLRFENLALNAGYDPS